MMHLLYSIYGSVYSAIVLQVCFMFILSRRLIITLIYVLFLHLICCYFIILMFLAIAIASFSTDQYMDHTGNMCSHFRGQSMGQGLPNYVFLFMYFFTNAIIII